MLRFSLIERSLLLLLQQLLLNTHHCRLLATDMPATSTPVPDTRQSNYYGIQH
jgi:hypothetical protein